MKQFTVGFKSTGSCLTTAFFMSAMLALAGCGGSGSSGDDVKSPPPTKVFNQDPGTIQNESDAKGSAEAAQQTAEQAIREDGTDLGSIPVSVGVTQNSMSEYLLENALSTIDIMASASGYTTRVDDTCGNGYATVSGPDGGGAGGVTKVVYNDFCSGGATINGYYTFDFSDGNGTAFTATFDYTIREGGETYHASGTCNQNGCSSNYVGTNGETYRVENVSVTDSGSGYSVSARVYDGDFGYVDYVASNLVLCGAPDYGFQSGSIVITDSSNTEIVTVVFSDCSSYTVAYNGEPPVVVNY